LTNYPRTFLDANESGTKTWQQHYDGVSTAGTMVLTPDGGFAIVGTSWDGNVMIIRTNSRGDVDWRKTYGEGAGNGIALVGDGGFVVAAAKTSIEGNTSWLIKTDSNGNEVWNKEYDGNGFQCVIGVNDGSYVILGKENSGGVEYASLVKVDSAMNVQWIRNYSSSQAPVNDLYTLIETSDGGYAAAGEIQFSINSVKTLNGWFLKTDSNGEVQVNRPFSMDGWTVFNSVAQTSDGGYILVGATANSSSAPYSACLVRTDLDGHSLWAQINQTLSITNADKGSGFELFSIVKVGDHYFIAGYLGEVGTTFEEIKDSGQILQFGSFSFSGQLLTERTPGYIIANAQNGNAWVGYSNSSIWLVDNYQYTK